MNVHTTLLQELPEKDWQRQVIDLARLLGWRVAHFRPAQTSKGWRTPVAADGAGFPDLVLVRDRIIYLELKREIGKLTVQQRDWIRALADAHAEVYVARPHNLTALGRMLAHRGRPQFTNELLAELGKEIGR